METKLEKAKKLYTRDPLKALSFCKKWRNLGKNRKEIIRGAECVNNPSIYMQMGYDTNKCIEEAIQYLGKHIKVL